MTICVIPCNSSIDLDVVVILLHLMLSIFGLVGGADEHLGDFCFHCCNINPSIFLSVIEYGH